MGNDVARCQKNMVYIPEGTFKMGSTNTAPDEQPIRDVKVSEFCIDKHEFTKGEFAILSNSYKFQAIIRRCGTGPTSVVARGNNVNALWNANVNKVDLKKNCGLEIKPTVHASLDDVTDLRPLVEVSWSEADALCKGFGKRLPTEVEWEKAAGGPEGKEYATAGGMLRKTEANYDSDGAKMVMSYKSNAYGVYDMTGNVSEWTADWYTNNNFNRDETGTFIIRQHKVMRGGNWGERSENRLRVNYRDDRAVPDEHYSYIGFRCVAAAAPQESKK